MRCRPSQKARLHESVKGAARGRHVALRQCQNMYKYPEIKYRFSFPASVCTSTDDRGELSLCLSPHDACTTYTYLHCPMRLSRLGNLSLSDTLNLHSFASADADTLRFADRSHADL